ncbi:MAG: Glu-tRNA(Gln) amidotransferase subunit GatE [Desulfurococcaceae archaeon]
MNINYESLGLKVGLEIHVQLNTPRKLFCPCPTETKDTSTYIKFHRQLRPARSEVGEVDPAAMLEWKKSKIYTYEAPIGSSCLVEADEEPPHPLNEEALIVALAVAKALKMNIVDEVHVMRKIVIDGSNVSGFQRTALIAIGGYIDVEGRKIGIQTLCLEEDAARKIDEKENEVIYSLDRLGIPLIEVATAPDIDSPELALKTALKIGQLIRLTGFAKRGLGSIRQDINISISGGAKIEIKGIQYLYLIPRVVEYEVMRQLKLLELKDELINREVEPSEIENKIFDVTHLFSNTQSKLIKKALSTDNTAVLAVKLPGFKGLLKKELQPDRRFGTELSDYAKVWGSVGGILHTDELPAYGITSEEVQKLYREVGGDPEKDAIVIVADVKSKGEKALRAVIERARLAFIGVPEETRVANIDGTTKYMRPRPGAARMYPETDISPISITQELLDKSTKHLPEHPDVIYKRLVEKHGLSNSLASALINDLRLDLYDYLASKYGEKIPYTVIASILVNTIPSLRRDGVPVDDLDESIIEKVVEKVSNGEIAKEAIPDLLAYLANNPGKSVDEAIETLELKKPTLSELDTLVERIINSNREKILSRPDKAFSIVMGEVMKIVRGKIDGKVVAERVKIKLRDLTNIQ